MDITSYMNDVFTVRNNMDFSFTVIFILDIIKSAAILAVIVLLFIVLLKLNRYLNYKLKEHNKTAK